MGNIQNWSVVFKGKILRGGKFYFVGREAVSGVLFRGRVERGEGRVFVSFVRVFLALFTVLAAGVF